MRVEPIGDKIVIQRFEPDEKTAGGIFLPSSSQEKPAEGRVLSVGTGPMLANGSRVSPQVGEGDRVIFSSYAGTEVVVADQELIIISEKDILAVIE